MEWRTGRLVLTRGQFSCLSSWQYARPHFAFLSSAFGWSEEGPNDLWGPSKSTQRIYEFVIPSQLVDSTSQKQKNWSLKKIKNKNKKDLFPEVSKV